jgi:hypothetical protein
MTGLSQLCWKLIAKPGIAGAAKLGRTTTASAEKSRRL